MKIFTSAQIHELDKYTIEHEPITSLNLMERAAKALTRAIEQEWSNRTPVVVFAGPGNNGGDALAVARLLSEDGYGVSVFLFNVHNKLSADCATNKKRLIEGKRVKQFTEVTVNFDPPQLEAGMLVVDGLFGSGLNKPLAGGFAAMVKYINQSAAKIVSIDLPSGLMSEDNSYNISANIIRADLTLTLQQKKLSMMMADNQQYLGRIKVLDIRLSPEFIQRTESRCSILEEKDIRQLLKPRGDFAHKGSMGTALLIAGSYGMSGASVLATRACLRTGVGKVSAACAGGKWPIDAPAPRSVRRYSIAPNGPSRRNHSSTPNQRRRAPENTAVTSPASSSAAGRRSSPASCAMARVRAASSGASSMASTSRSRSRGPQQ